MIHVYVGPTLPACEPSLAAPGLRLRPPVRHGDLFDAVIRRGDTVLILDGVYHQAPALRHKEILAAIGRGVRVIGAASIGALRAAELARFGMLGVGSVYAAYASGDLDGDDEVAVAVGQTPDGEQQALTWPLVNLRHVLGLARSAGVLDAERARRLFAAMRGVYYPQRTSAAVRAVCRRDGEAEFARWLDEQRARDRHFGDLKRVDALAGLRAAHGAWTPQATTPHLPETTHMRRWSNAFARRTVDGLDLSTEDRLLYQQVFDPAFPKTWVAYLEHRSRHPLDGGPGLPLAERLVQATSGNLAVHQVFHPVPDLRDEASVTLLLSGETPEDRRAVAEYADMLAQTRRTRCGFSTAAVRDDLARRVLLHVWRCPPECFDAEASARGLVAGSRAVAAAKRLVPGFLAEQARRREAG